MGRFDPFRPAALDFFRRLRRRNTREWFEAQRAAYEQQVRRPLLALVEEVDIRIARVAPEIIGDPRHSIFRLHRDIRFSRDKSPYKTHAACWFYHRDAGRGVGSRSEGGAGFYFHLSSDESFLGGGLWMPPRASLTRVRGALAENPETFEATVRAPAFRRCFARIDQEHQLRRLPRGFAPGHPAERWLRYQSFTASRPLTRRELLSPRLPDILIRNYRALLPLVRWLNRAIGYLPAEHRL